MLKTIGQRVRVAREQRGMSQAELARRLQASVNSINMLEQDTTLDPRASRIIGVAKALDVSADYLLGLTENPRPRRRQQPSSADTPTEEAEVAMCECGVGGGLHRPDCRVLAARVADDPEAAAALERGRRITEKLLELAGQAVPHG